MIMEGHSGIGVGISISISNNIFGIKLGYELLNQAIIEDSDGFLLSLVFLAFRLLSVV
jgi:hypothetical protein